jgi:hypothetical protein
VATTTIEQEGWAGPSRLEVHTALEALSKGGRPPWWCSNGDLSSLDDDDLVQVTGTVRWFNREAFVRELGVTLDPATFHVFKGGVAVAAPTGHHQRHTSLIGA